MMKIADPVRTSGLNWIRWRRSPPSIPRPLEGKKAANGVFLEGQTEQAGNVAPNREPEDTGGFASSGGVLPMETGRGDAAAIREGGEPAGQRAVG